MTLPNYDNPRWRTPFHRLPPVLQDAVTTAYGWQLRWEVHGSFYRWYRRALDTSQWRDERQFAELQAQVLSRFVRRACADVPYWGEVFANAGLDPRSVTQAGDLTCLPLLTKPEVRRLGSALVAASYKRRGAPTVRLKTSGTTGASLEVTLSRECWQRDYAFRDQQRSWAGAVRGAPIVSFSSKPLVPPERTAPPFWRHNRAENQTFFSVQHISQKSLPFYVDEVVRLQPRLVTGTPAGLALFARHLAASRPDDVAPAGVIVHSETLYPFQREVIERAFHCHAFSWYGNAEVSANIVECEHGSLHVRPEYSVVELLRPDGSPAQPGEVAEIVGTGFGNAAMPLIRYRTGDTVVVAEEQQCACGRRMPVVETIVGRLEDVLLTADGRMVTRFETAFNDSVHVVEAQLFQAEPGVLEVRLVTDPGYDEAEQRVIARELRVMLGPAMTIGFRRVESIPRDPGGKFRFVLSKVKAP